MNSATKGVRLVFSGSAHDYSLLVSQFFATLENNGSGK